MDIIASISDGSSRNAGGETRITADTYDEAVEAAVEWVREGDYSSSSDDEVQVRLVIAETTGKVIEIRTVTVVNACMNALKAELKAAGYDAQACSSGLRIPVTDGVQGDGTDVDGEPDLEAIRAIAERHGAEADWSGDGNTDDDGDSTSDVIVGVA